MPDDDRPETTVIDWSTAPSYLRDHARGLEKGLKAAKAEIARLTAGDDADSAAELARLRQQNIALKVGLDLDSPFGRLFASGYGGEWEAEAVKAALDEIGVAAQSSEPSGLDDAARAERDAE